MPEDDVDRLPLFCSTALAERIERVEAQLIAKGSEAAARIVRKRARRGHQGRA